jgi:hypothetical protein
MGLTWKSYVHPVGSSANTYYSGQLWIPNVTGGGLQRIAGVLDHQYLVPANLPPLAASQLVLWLGFQDEPGDYGDNGYWGHDDGNNNQCANVGPAWVQLKIFHPAKASTTTGNAPVFAPWSKPFDVTWDEQLPGDDNGFPINPMWGYQVGHYPNQPPNFAPTCSSAFSGGNTVNYSTLSKNCTTQMPTMDLFTGWDWFGALCPGNPLNGHLNWQLVTYQGDLLWRSYSGPWTSLGDYDYNFGLETVGEVGETQLSESNDLGIGMEFDSRETVDNWDSGWWNTFSNANDATKSNMVNGEPAMVTGLLGIDGVHGGYSEIHPVFSLAVLTAEVPSGDGVDETWSFFIRNWGDEGECSSNLHVWPGLDGNAYAIQVPWPDDATKVSLVGNATQLWVTVGNPLAPGQQGQGNVEPSLNLEAQSPWTFLEFELPPVNVNFQNPVDIDGGAVEGQIVLHYALPAGMKMKSRRVRVAEPPKGAELLENVDWAKVEARIVNPLSKKLFDAQMQQVQQTYLIPKLTMAKLTFSPQVGAHHSRSDASKKGTRMHDRAIPDPWRAAYNASMQQLYNRYRTELATPP